MTNKQSFVIRFEGENVADAGQKASELRYELLDISPDVRADIVKEDKSTQDFGATLVLILGTSAVTAIAKGIADYLARSGGSITITTREGKVVAKGIKSSDAAKIAQAFASKK